jgi:hypothetical protein
MPGFWQRTDGMDGCTQSDLTGHRRLRLADDVSTVPVSRMPAHPKARLFMGSWLPASRRDEIAADHARIARRYRSIG